MRRILVTGLALLAAGCAVPVEEDPAPAVTQDARELSPDTIRLPPLPLPPEADLSALELAVAARMQAVTEITVEVEQRSGDEVVGHGSGVLVSADGDVLTAAHVVRDKTRTFRVVLPGGESRLAQVVARDEAHDAALIHAPGGPTPFARLPARTRQPGEWAVCSGHGGDVANDRLPTRSAGVIVERAYAWTVWELSKGSGWRSELVKGPTFWGMIRLDCATAPGMSGGPVVGLDGELVGVVVGAGGVVSPIEGIRHLLRSPKTAEAPQPSPVMPAEPSATGPDHWRSRHGTLDPLFAGLGAERSVVELEIKSSHWGHRFPAVIVSYDDLVVVPTVRLSRVLGPEPTVLPGDITVVDHPDARVAEVVAVRGELALLRLSGLFPARTADGAEPEEGPRPVGPAGAAAVGEIVAAIRPPARRAIGFVTSVDRHPGTVGPPGPRGGCGYRQGLFRESFPYVSVASALAHDAELPEYGSLLVDRHGRPVAVEVASVASGVDFAVPWTEVLARFDEWLRP